MSRCLTHLSVRDCPQDSPTMMILHKERVFVDHFRSVKRLPEIDLDFRKFILKPYPTYLQITMSFSKMKQILFKNSMILPNMLLLLPNKNETDPSRIYFSKTETYWTTWWFRFKWYAFSWRTLFIEWPFLTDTVIIDYLVVTFFPFRLTLSIFSRALNSIGTKGFDKFQNWNKIGHWELLFKLEVLII